MEVQPFLFCQRKKSLRGQIHKSNNFPEEHPPGETFTREIISHRRNPPTGN